MDKIFLKVAGMTCNSCKKKVEHRLSELSFVSYVLVNLDDNLVIVNEIDNDDEINIIIDLITELGYDTSLDEVYYSLEDKKKGKYKKIIRILITFLYIILIYFLIKKLFGFDFLNLFPSIDNNISLPILFVIGLMTSIHCVGMCGAINIAASMGKGKKRSYKKPLLYNLGRVISYTITGGIAGLIGKVLAPSLFFQGIMVGIASIVMLFMGLSMLGLVTKKILNIFPKSKKLSKIKSSQPFVLGLLNGFMPCGPLQAMQVYAVSTASFILGALSMLLFSLGTVPLMLLFGFVVNLLKGKKLLVMQRFSASLVILLSFLMFFRAMGYLGINILSNSSTYQIATIKEDGNQYVEVDIENSSYEKIYAQKDVPLIINFKVKDGDLNGCNNPIMIPFHDVKKKLVEGDNIIEITPTIDTSYSCWMSMIRSQIIVVEDIKNFKIN